MQIGEIEGAQKRMREARQLLWNAERSPDVPEEIARQISFAGDHLSQILTFLEGIRIIAQNAEPKA